MRTAPLIFVGLLFVLPSLALAADPAPKGTVKGSNDKCLNEEVKVGAKGKAEIPKGKVGDKNNTKEQQYKTCNETSGGCDQKKEKAKECTCGRVSYTTLAKKTVNLDKCDPDMQKKLEKAMGVEGGMETFALQTLIGDRIKDFNVSPPSKDQLSQILSEFGVPKVEADAKSKNIDSNDLLAQLQKLTNEPDLQEAKDIGKGLGLNYDLSGDPVPLSPQKNGEIPSTDDESKGPQAEPETFPDAPEKPNIAEVVSPMCDQPAMKGCGNVCDLPGANRLTCGANNPGALTYTAWQQKYGGYACGLPNNTTCYPSLEAGIAAQYNLLTTSSRYFGNGDKTIQQAFCKGYSTENCAPYALFISQQTGIPMNQTIDPNNPEQMAKIMMASSRFENGKGVIYTPEQLQRGIEIFYGDRPIPAGTPGYTPRDVPGTQFGSPFNVGGSAAPATVSNISPFSQASPVPIGQPAYTPQQSSPFSQQQPQPQAPAPVSQPFQPTQALPSGQSTIAQPAVSTQGQTTSGQSSVADRLKEALYGPTPTAPVAGQSGQSIATILTQPRTVTRGNSITVSWSTMGMSQSSPCTVLANSTVIGRKNEGSIVVPTNQSTRLGSLIFTLTCTSVSGASVQKTAATFVQ